MRALKLPIDATITSSAEFTDVTGWAAPYIYAARNAGIIEGVSHDRFRPGGLLTREQAAKLLFSALTWSNPNIHLEANAIPLFADVDLISEWAKPYVAMASELGLVAGRPEGTFDPQRVATREMAAVMASNLLDALDAFRGMPHDESAPPSAPTHFTAAAFSGSDITFTWNAPPDAADIAGYDLYMGWENKLGSTTETSYTAHDVNLTMQKTMFFVIARDAQRRQSDRSDIYYVSKTEKTKLIIQPGYNTFKPQQEQQMQLRISGSISQEDSQRRAKLYMTIEKATGRDITFGSIAGLGQPEFIQEGTASQPLVVAWGGDQGFELSTYSQYESYLNTVLQLPVTLNRSGFYSVRIDLRTAGDAPVELASSKFIMTDILLQAAQPNDGWGVTAQLIQPPPSQINRQITIPVTLQGQAREPLSDLVALQLRIFDEKQLLTPADIRIEDSAEFGHANVVFNNKEFKIVQFDRYLPLQELQQRLDKGITFNLVITLRQPGSFGIFATLDRVDENGRLKGPTGSGGTVITVAVQ